MSMRGRDAYERGDPSLRGSGGSGRGSRTVDRIPSHSHSTPTDLALARPPLPLKLSAPFSYASLRLILPLIATPSHRSSPLTCSALPKDRSIDYSAAEVISEPDLGRALTVADDTGRARRRWGNASRIICGRKKSGEVVLVEDRSAREGHVARRARPEDRRRRPVGRQPGGGEHARAVRLSPIPRMWLHRHLDLDAARCSRDQPEHDFEEEIMTM